MHQPPSGRHAGRVVDRLAHPLRCGRAQGVSAGECAVGRGDSAQTILEFRHSGLDDASPYFAMCSFAWGEVLLNLQQVCQGQGGATGNA